MARLIERMFELAKAQLTEDWKEKPGPGSNPKILEVYKAVDGISNPETRDDSLLPWCSCFANWIAQKSGGKGTRSAMARSWLYWGRASDGKVGDIVVFKRGNDGISGHVGFVYKQGLVWIEVLGGNQTNQVCVSKYNKLNVLGYRTSKD